MVDGEITLLLLYIYSIPLPANNNSINWISTSRLNDENKTGN